MKGKPLYFEGSCSFYYRRTEKKNWNEINVLRCVSQTAARLEQAYKWRDEQNPFLLQPPCILDPITGSQPQVTKQSFQVHISKKEFSKF